MRRTRMARYWVKAGWSSASTRLLYGLLPTCKHFTFLTVGSTAHVYPASELGLRARAIMGCPRVWSSSDDRALRHTEPIRFSRRRFDLFAINVSCLAIVKNVALLSTRLRRGQFVWSWLRRVWCTPAPFLRSAGRNPHHLPVMPTPFASSCWPTQRRRYFCFCGCTGSAASG